MLGFAACAAPAERRPNLLLISVDTLRADRLACHGGPADTGVALCAIAESGYRYEWALSPAPSTAPAIASLLTSRYPAYHGVGESAQTALASEALTLAELLREAGYRTGAVIANPVLAGARGLEQGFDVYDAELNRSERNRPGYLERDAEHATDAALAWLGGGRGPWFLWIHYQDPHGPYEPPGAGPARDAAGSTPLRALSDHSGRGGIPLYQRLGEARAAASYERRYLDEIRYLDGQIERLLERVHELPGGTGIALTADHGEAFGEDGYWFAHGHSVGLDQLHVPLLWRPPGTPRAGPSHAIAAPVSTLDLAPTLLEAAGIALPESFQGRPLPRDAASAVARPFFAEQRLRAAVVLGSRYLARDRRPFSDPVADPISGGWLLPIAARTAALEGAATGVAYAAAGASPRDAALESLLADYLARSAHATPSGPAVELSPEARAALSALGYLE